METTSKVLVVGGGLAALAAIIYVGTRGGRDGTLAGCGCKRRKHRRGKKR